MKVKACLNQKKAIISSLTRLKNKTLEDINELDSSELKIRKNRKTREQVIDEWLTFSDLFQAAVTNNQNLTGAQKLQYLKGVLKGDVQKIVQSLPITDGNFQIAWDLLKERYFHKREILSNLMKKLMNISPITYESHAQILKLVDSTKECVRLLETLDLKVEGTADIILMFIIQFKLDSTTRGWWERSLDSEKIPSLSELLQFLSNHARSLMTEGYGVKRNISNKKVTLVASGFQLHCSYCQNNHNLNKCDAFQNLSVQKRVNFVKSNNICFNCLTQFHRKSACKSTNKCRKCGKSHHTLLHFMTPSKPNSSIPRDANNSVLSTSAQVFHPVMSDATNTDTGPNPPNVNNPSITSCSGFDSISGHMDLVPKHDYAKREAYYLPHHEVLRDSSTTTKLSVVFDASAKSTTGHSLNDLLMVGPRVQRDVYPILLSPLEHFKYVCRLGKDVPSNKDLIGRYQLATNSMER
ncbi:integrase catalytic domain-containing protein [Trichonephila inaurata madagascariensis]|uniref:Integrase catalytic domain-containing protein n=1 Tax=Trichonephila inaurata madagascariensis TaxID=2747483 RepID=A0A8X6JSB4_9ARAC|nr:integrase catalytic domain-containing protein [Trichonephila inaurata madagascariensis]